VIDGQQRLTTLSVLLCAIRDHRAKTESAEHRERIDQQYLTNKWKPEKQRLKLVPTQADRAAYLACLNSTPQAGGSDRLGAAYRFFSAQLAAADDPEDATDIERIEDAVISGLALVSVTAQRADNPHRILESLTNTGQRLSQADLLRNYLFMRLPTRGEVVYASGWLPLQGNLDSGQLELLFRLDLVQRDPRIKQTDIRTAFEPYFTNATLETETDPYVVFHLATKLAQAGIYTPEQVREVAELWVTRKGNNALSAAISPAKNEFARRYAAAIGADDKVTLNTLDLFRKDVSTLVRLYDFMSQIIDDGDPYMEMLSIFLRLLEKVIADSSWTAEVDLSDVILVGIQHNKGTAVDISLTGDGELKGISAAGTGTRKEPKYVALQVVIDKMNDLFGAESFTASQVREFVQGLVQRLLAYPDLINQTRVNSKKQFIESQDFQAAVTEAVVDNQEAQDTMADYFFSDGPAISAVIMALADAFYEAAIDQQTDL
jgi:hypothetical protein